MKKFCLIGEKLPHTLSPLIHSHFGYEYGIEELPSADDIGPFMENCKYDGFNVTVPYKQDVMKHLDYIDDLALEIGAVNTVMKKDGKWCGYNSDIYGLEYSLQKSGISLEDKTIAIMGSGGTRMTAQLLAKKHGAKRVVIVSRNGEINYDNFYKKYDIQIIFNTTPSGMFPHMDELPFDISKIKTLEGAFDVIYNPLRTNFLLLAKKAGIAYENGLRMLVEQARVSRDIWFSENSSTDDTERILKQLLKSQQNIVLVGMPACGKSTIGKNIARQLDMEFFDADIELEKYVGKTPAEIISSDGEDVFRKIESEVIANLASKRGVVIATGGGAVLKEENRTALMRTGVVFYINREVSKLSTYGRPISQKNSLAELFEKRRPLYEQIADYELINNDVFFDTADKIVEIINKY
ncbi:MAG: shikimate kinase [Bacillota bacterium]